MKALALRMRLAIESVSHGKAPKLMRAFPKRHAGTRRSYLGHTLPTPALLILCTSRMKVLVARTDPGHRSRGCEDDLVVDIPAAQFPEAPAATSMWVTAIVRS